jgi:hypothetical protein
VGAQSSGRMGEPAQPNSPAERAPTVSRSLRLAMYLSARFITGHLSDWTDGNTAYPDADAKTPPAKTGGVAWGAARAPLGLRSVRSLSDLTLIYCGKADFGYFLHSFLLNRTTIHNLHPCSLPCGQQTLCKSAVLPIYRLKRAQKLPQNGLSLVTTGQVRQAACSDFFLAAAPGQAGSRAVNLAAYFGAQWWLYRRSPSYRFRSPRW